MAIQKYGSDVATVYNQQALHANQLISGTIKGNAALLKSSLPDGETLVEIGSEFTNKNGTKTIHKVAAFAFEKRKVNDEVKLKAVVTLYKYEEMNGEVHNQLAISKPSSSAIMHSSEGKEEFIHFDRNLISASFLQHLSSMDGNNRCPSSIKVIELINSVFPNGLPLPKNMGTLKTTHLFVMIKNEDDRLEKITMYEGHDKKNVYLSTGIDNATTKEAHYENILKQFNQLRLVANGMSKPISIPAHAQGTSSTLAYTEQRNLKN